MRRTSADFPADRSLEKGLSENEVLSELWVLLEKADIKISAFSLSSLFSFLGIYGKVKIEKTKEDDQIEIFPNTGLLISIR